MIFPDHASPAEAGFAKAANRLSPSVSKSAGRLFRDHALIRGAHVNLADAQREIARRLRRPFPFGVSVGHRAQERVAQWRFYYL
jgi:hypothetical protein